MKAISPSLRFLAPALIASLTAAHVEHDASAERSMPEDRPRVATAANPQIRTPKALYFLPDLQAKQRADEQTRTAYPCSFRVISHALQGFAEACKTRISRLVSFLWLALCCTVLRSRWCQSGVNITLVATSDQKFPRVGSTTFVAMPQEPPTSS
jgi:hypothetical protein